MIAVSRPVAALAPAFPHVVWLQGDGQLFSSLAAQMSLKGYPQLLLFEDGLLKVMFLITVLNGLIHRCIVYDVLCRFARCHWFANMVAAVMLYRRDTAAVGVSAL